MPDQDDTQIYLITPINAELSFAEELLKPMLNEVEIACIRLGLSGQDEHEIARHADAVREISHLFDIPVIITDHYRMVTKLGLDGVHLKENLRHLRDIRKELDAEAIIGAFCDTSSHAGMTAGEIGADYISFGPVAHSGLGHYEIADHDLFAWWSQMIELPVVAEGNFDASKVTELAPVVDFIALGEELWSTPEPLETLMGLRSRI